MEQDKRKIIFLTVSRAFIIRNILRSGLLDYLGDKYRIIAFALCKEVPEYLKEEFKDAPVTFVPISDPGIGRIHRRVNRITTFLLFSDSTKRYLKYGNKEMIARSRIRTYIHMAFVWFISHIPFLKAVMRWIERTFFPERYEQYAKFFDEYKPDLVFSSSIISTIDIVFLKEAKRRGITSVGMPKGWDNVTRNYYRFVPDYFIVQNEILKNMTAAMQDFPEDKIFVVGFPQFDWYRKDEILKSREEHFKKLGLDPKLPLIFFGSEGVWADKDYRIAKKIYEWVKNDELDMPCQMLVRPHFSLVKEEHFIWFNGKEKVAYDDTFRVSHDFRDNWDPTISETIDLANSLYHSQMLITSASTLNLDAACYDKPTINLGFGCKFQGEKDITAWLYKSNHLQWVLGTRAVELVYNEDELKKQINRYLKDNSLRSEGRKKLLDELCYKVDGKSSERMAIAIKKIMSA